MIRAYFQDLPSGVHEDRAHAGGLVVAEFKQEDAIGIQVAGEGVGEGSISREAVGAAIESQDGVMVADLRFQVGDILGRDIGWIADDKVESRFGRNPGGACGLDEDDPGFELKALSVAVCDGEADGGRVNGGDLGGGMMDGEGDREAAAAGSPVEDLGCGGIGREMGVEPGPGLFGEQFRFGAWDEDGAVDLQFDAAKGGGTENVLERFTLAAALDGGPDAVEGGCIQKSVELQVELESGDAKGVGEDPLDLESGGFDPARLQEGGATLDHLEDLHAGQLSLAGSGQQT